MHVIAAQPPFATANKWPQHLNGDRPETHKQRTRKAPKQNGTRRRHLKAGSLSVPCKLEGVS